MSINICAALTAVISMSVSFFAHQFWAPVVLRITRIFQKAKNKHSRLLMRFRDDIHEFIDPSVHSVGNESSGR